MSEGLNLNYTLNAPLNTVWRAFTEAEHLKNWWGPKGFRVFHITVDLRPGGVFHYGIESPQGHKMWGKFVYGEIRPEEFLEYIYSFSDESGGVTRHPMSDTWPLEILNQTTFTEAGGQTTITMVGWPINATPEEQANYDSAHDSMRAGFNGTIAQLAQYLEEVQNL